MTRDAAVLAAAEGFGLTETPESAGAYLGFRGETADSVRYGTGSRATWFVVLRGGGRVGEGDGGSAQEEFLAALVDALRREGRDARPGFARTTRCGPKRWPTGGCGAS